MADVGTITVSETRRDPRWDEFVEAFDGGCVVQTSRWGRIKNSVGCDSIRVVLEEADTIIGGAQILTTRIPMLGTLGYVPRGPLSPADCEETRRRLVEAIRQVAKDRGVKHLTIQPCTTDSSTGEVLERSGFRPTPRGVAPVATILVDLAQGVDAMKTGLRRQTRQGIEIAERRGLTVRRGTRDDLGIFHELLQETAARQRFSGFPFDYYESMWDELDPPGGVVLFIAERDGEAVSAELDILFRGYMIAKARGWSGQHGDCRPNQLLVWRAMKWGAENGHRWYDHEGIEPGAAGALLAGERLPERFVNSPTRFKLGFGGEVVQLPGAWFDAANPAVRWAYDTLGSRLADWEPLQRGIQAIRTRAR